MSSPIKLNSSLKCFSNLAINRNSEALKYLKFLEKHRKGKLIKLKYCNQLYNPIFDEGLYEKYIELLENNDKSKSLDYTFSNSPLNPYGDKKRSDKKIENLLKKFTKSYFIN